MHISNGIIDNQIALLFAAIALAGLGLCFVQGRRELDDRLAPMAGLVAAFIFAVQMLNFQVLPGVCGHLLGGTLAAILVGPWVGALCVSIVLVVQALLFADGGLTALGLNITNMALLGTAAGYLLVARCCGSCRARPGRLTATAVHRVAWSAWPSRRRASSSSTASAAPSTAVAGHGRRRDGRLARAHRHRRGRHHRAHRRHGRAGPPRPGLRGCADLQRRSPRAAGLRRGRRA